MPPRALVTGAGGFAGRHLVRHLRERGEDVIGPSSAELDLRDGDSTRAFVREARPARVFHLAALASVGRSWKEPERTLADNGAMTLSLLEAVRHESPDARVLIAGTGEAYGAPASLPVTEDAPLAPENPYALSKATCDMLGRLYARAWDLNVVRTRAFNHAGPGQSDDYVVGTLTKQVAAAEVAGRDAVVIRTGNPDSARDFTDVRDVVRAYDAAIELESDAYNIASERGLTVNDLLGALRDQTKLDIQHEVDPQRVRHHDVSEIRGSAARLREATGWQPQIPLEQTLADAIAWWRDELTQAA
jgi:GDP-4-dehydro-6-deoxy-D-mannose reductase